ncbi:helix-turn-helix domain-containing protein [Pandoraea sputorum]|uniref:Virulence regulon transcriptional activator VirF n=1 Tax=Pandoraea sputorum TaxID=93222 RepID=A0A5E5BK85_9BURK|nr:helix-turn-helix domain-containing protein [Pandoraea sputorum]VVE85676.1 Virulence regulon transcriptional activator VirF [Pandoraea sputorum]
MSSLHMILVRHHGTLRVGASPHVVAPGLWLVAGGTPPSPSAGAQVYSLCGTSLQSVFREVQPLLVDGGSIRALAPHQPHAVPAERGLLDAVARLAELNPDAMWRFTLAYCLVAERSRCSTLLRHLVSADFALCDFLHQHRLEPWPVTRYADALELPLRKFTQLFKDKYGTSPKHWLQAQRLEHARRLLETTSKKVIEIALECGFCTAAHFSESFRRHFNVSPRDARQQARPLNAARPHDLKEPPMDFNALTDSFASTIASAETKLNQAVAAAAGKSDPASLLALQTALQSWTMAFSTLSGAEKATKDTMAAIVHNF